MINKFVLPICIMLIIQSFGISQDISLHVTEPTLPNCNDGVIDLQIDGGFAPYNVIWFRENTKVKEMFGVTGNDGSEDLMNASVDYNNPKNFEVVVTDALCGIVRKDVTIECICSDICQFNTMELEHASCSENGKIETELVCDGIVKGPWYKYKWSDGAIGKTRNNLTPGTYTVTYDDVLYGCIYSKTYDISGIAAVQMSLKTIFYPDCSPVSCNGSIDIEVSGGYGNYTYEWRNGTVDDPNAQDPTGLCASDGGIELLLNDYETPGGPLCYSYIYYFDFCCCDNTGEEYCWHGRDKSPIEITRLANENDNIVVNVSGGAPQLPGAGDNSYGCTWRKMPGGSIMGYDCNRVKTNGYGTYCLSVYDGCDQKTECFDFVDCSNFDLDANIINDCYRENNGSISLTVVNGESPITFNWYNGGGGNSSSVGGLGAGTYCVNARDNNGCSIDKCFDIKEGLDPIPTTDPCGYDLVCNGEKVDFMAVEPDDCVPSTSDDCDLNCRCPTTGERVDVEYDVNSRDGYIDTNAEGTDYDLFGIDVLICYELVTCSNGGSFESGFGTTISLPECRDANNPDELCNSNPCDCYQVIYCQVNGNRHELGKRKRNDRDFCEELDRCFLPIANDRVNNPTRSEIVQDDLTLFNVVPNPFNSNINIKSKTSNRNTELIVKLYSSIGKEVVNIADLNFPNKNGHKIDTEKLPSGVYFLVIQDKKGKTLQVTRLAKIK